MVRILFLEEFDCVLMLIIHVSPQSIMAAVNTHGKCKAQDWYERYAM